MLSRQRLTGLLCKERFSDLEFLAELIAAGELTPSVGTTYPLDQVPQAMRDLERGSVRGKVAIAV
jgi:NADPH:quinone reductase-like Zn-dependent oxidoreductase